MIREKIKKFGSYLSGMVMPRQIARKEYKS